MVYPNRDSIAEIGHDNTQATPVRLHPLLINNGSSMANINVHNRPHVGTKMSSLLIVKTLVYGLFGSEPVGESAIA